MKNFDHFFLSLIIILVLGGLIILTSASSDLGVKKFNDPYFYLKHQIIFGLLPGIILFFIFLIIPLDFLKKFSFYFLVINILFLILVIFSPLGVKIKGAERWLKLGPISFQPAEFLKLTFFIYFSAWLANKQKSLKSFKEGVINFLILIGLIAFLILKQPATSIFVIILASGLITYFISNVKLRYLIFIFLLAVLVIVTLIFHSPYRYERFLSYLKPDLDPYGKNYHALQAKIAIGSGGLFGVGFGKSISKINYLPEPISDSIFAVFAEETGFVGSTILIFLYLFLILRCLLIARNLGDNFYKNLVIGFCSLVGIQTFIHIASNSGLIVLTGQPLPFISYGGTSLVVFLSYAALVLNISKYRYRK